MLTSCVKALLVPTTTWFCCTVTQLQQFLARKRSCLSSVGRLRGVSWQERPHPSCHSHVGLLLPQSLDPCASCQGTRSASAHQSTTTVPACKLIDLTTHVRAIHIRSESPVKPLPPEPNGTSAHYDHNKVSAEASHMRRSKLPTLKAPRQAAADAWKQC